MTPTNVKSNFAILLVLPVLLLSGCGLLSTHSVPPSLENCPVIPPAPPLMQPLPSQSYLESARINIEEWLKRLTDTPAMPAR